MKIYKRRIDPILKYIKGDVLDIGCIGMGKEDEYGGGNFLHKVVAEKTDVKSLTGMEVQKEKIYKLNALGFNIIEQSADEKFDLHRQFDVIIAEEVIEHLYNTGIFLDNVKRHLKEHGLFVITTPNPQSFQFFIHMILFGKPLVNEFHTHWHSKATLGFILKNNGFEIINFMFFEDRAPNLKGLIYQKLFFFLPRHFSRNMACIARLKKYK